MPAVNALVSFTTANVNAIHTNGKDRSSPSRKRIGWIYYCKRKRHSCLDSRTIKQWILIGLAMIGKANYRDYLPLVLVTTLERSGYHYRHP